MKLYPICHEHNVQWLSPNVTCALCEEIDAAAAAVEYQHTTVGDLMGEIDRLMEEIVRNSREFER